MVYLRHLMLLCVFFFVPLSADEDTVSNSFLDEQESLYISLGADCRAAHFSSLAGLKKASFPFDWILSLNTKSVSRLIRDNFEFFLDEGCFEKHPTYTHVMVNNYYGIEFRHEWNCNLWNDFYKYKEDFGDIQIKYQRRIDRFFRLADYKGKVFFIRAAFNPNMDSNIKDLPIEQRGTTYEEAVELRNALREKFPKLDLTLVIANYIGDIEAPFDIEGVIEFKFIKPAVSEDQDMINMFKQLKEMD